jgi:ABC-type transporter Mla MlaB component
MSEALVVTVTRQPDGILVGLAGELDCRGQADLFSAWSRPSGTPARSPHLDLSGLTRMDTSGLSALVKMAVEARAAGATVSTGGAGAALRGIFETSGLMAGLGVEVAAPPDGGHWEPATEWCQPTLSMRVDAVPPGAVSLNVAGRRPVGPLLGFGRLWQKVYRVCLPAAAASPEQAMAALKTSLPAFQPPSSHFYPSPAGIRPGEVVLINASVLGLPVFTGVMVLYADALSFTLITPQGHPESGWVTFRAYEEERGTVVEVESLARANDPIYEFGLRVLGAARVQEGIWRHVLTSLAESFGARAEVAITRTLLDGRMQWGQAGNIRYNAELWSLLANISGRA